MDLANDDAAMRMFVSANEYLRHTNLLALFNLIREIHPRSLSRLDGQIIDGGMKLGIWKSLVVIEGQHVVAIAGDVEIGDKAGQPLNRSPAKARHCSARGCPRSVRLAIRVCKPSWMRKGDEEVAGVTFVVVHQIAVHLHIAETVRLIKLGKRSDVTA